MHTPGVKTIADLCAFLKVPAERTVKAVVVDGADGEPVLLLLRGDHELNLIKAGKLDARRKAGAVRLGGAISDRIRRARRARSARSASRAR